MVRLCCWLLPRMWRTVSLWCRLDAVGNPAQARFYFMLTTICCSRACCLQYATGSPACRFDSYLLHTLVRGHASRNICPHDTYALKLPIDPYHFVHLCLLLLAG